MSAAFVPGLILRAAPSSGFEVASSDSSFDRSTPGLWGPNCTSGMGGGDGRRGELDGEMPDLEGVTAVMLVKCARFDSVPTFDPPTNSSPARGLPRLTVCSVVLQAVHATTMSLIV